MSDDLDVSYLIWNSNRANKYVQLILQIENLINLTEKLKKETQIMASTQADLDTAITNLQAASDALIADVNSNLTEALAAINRLLAKIAAGTPPTALDLTTEVTNLTATQQKLASLQTAVQSATASDKVEGV